MSELFRNTLPLWQWAILALVPLAIVALYFLKLKRLPLEVPSTYLWKRTIEDLHVNSLWQRLRQNLLMLLQLLLVGLAMLALVRPGWQGTRLEGQRFIFLVDNSASMSATDAGDAPNRLVGAKQAAAGLIDQMDSNMTAMIISFADTPQVVQEFTNDRRLLAERLASIGPTAGGTNLHAALDLARGLGKPGRGPSAMGDNETAPAEHLQTTLYILSDGRFDDIKDYSLGTLQPVYVPIGSFDADNLAITALTTRQSEARSEDRQVFIEVTNYTNDAQSEIVELQLDGRFLDAQEINVAAGESAAVVFALTGAPPGALIARLKHGPREPANRDVLQQDDVAYAALNDAAPGQVLVVTPGNPALETALQTARARRLADVRFALPAILDTEDYQRDADGGTYDLVIYDQCSPLAMPRAGTVFIGRLPPEAGWQRDSGGKPASRANDASGGASADETPDAAGSDDHTDSDRVDLPLLIDWNHGHPLLAHVELGSVDVAESLILRIPPGGDVLIDSTAGPIAAIAPRESYEDVVLGFQIVSRDGTGAPTFHTNWPGKLSFPTFWLNALEYFGVGGQLARTVQVRPGRPVELRVVGDIDELTVLDPESRATRLRHGDQDVLPFHDTGLPGVYQVRQGDRVSERFAVNLFDRAESDVRLRASQDATDATVTPAEIRIGHVEIAASVGQAPARKELWKAILAGALVVLLVEWYIFHRRVYL